VCRPSPDRPEAQCHSNPRMAKVTCPNLYHVLDLRWKPVPIVLPAIMKARSRSLYPSMIMMGTADLIIDQVHLEMSLHLDRLTRDNNHGHHNKLRVLIHLIHCHQCPI
jgi:hypothetical protein